MLDKKGICCFLGYVLRNQSEVDIIIGSEIEMGMSDFDMEGFMDRRRGWVD